MPSPQRAGRPRYDNPCRLGQIPFPERLTVCGLAAGSSDMLSVPVLVPAVPGLKVTEIVQFVPASRLVPQVLVSAKSPLVVMVEIGTGVSPGLVRVTVWAPLVVPTT